MKKNKLWLIVAIFLLAGFLWMRWMPRKADAPTTTETGITKSPPRSADMSSRSEDQKQLPQNIGNADAQNQKKVEREKKIWGMLFLTPIDFYGKVIDQSGSTIPQANVSLLFANKLSGGGTEETTQTDNNGVFHASGHGLGINVQVSKEGYYVLKESRGTFAYAEAAGKIDRHTDLVNPAIFVLRKMGQPVALIHLKKCIRLKKDGTPVEVDLATGKTGQTGIRVEAWIYDQSHQPNSNDPYDWRCRISVSGGGLVARKGEFDFAAPSDNYSPSDEINMPALANNQWQDQVSRQYFLKLADGRYARIEFEITAGGDHYFVINSYLNPTPGDRNLEFDASKQIPVKP